MLEILRPGRLASMEPIPGGIGNVISRGLPRGRLHASMEPIPGGIGNVKRPARLDLVQPRFNGAYPRRDRKPPPAESRLPAWDWLQWSLSPEG